MQQGELKNSTINGLVWSFLDNLSRQIVVFVVGIYLARLLEPAEFGLIGLITVVIAVSQTIIDSGLTQALIRKKECTPLDYSTVFLFNLFLSIFIYAILYIAAPFISAFFNEPKLELLTRVIGIGVILGSLTIIQRVKLTRDLNFKLQTKITLVATIFSGVLGIALAYQGFGVWSLVARILAELLIVSLLLIFYNKWIPSLQFSISVFKKLFGYSSKLLLSSLLDTLYKNLYFLVIGKSFSTINLGYYTRAEQFEKLPTQNLNSVIQQVSFPILSKIQDDPIRLKEVLQKLITHTMFVSFILTLGLAAISESLILSTIGEKWGQSIVYLQLLCFASMLYPLHAINLNILNVFGFSGRFLKLEIVKKLMIIPFILLGIKYGMLVLLCGIVVNSFLVFFVNTYYSKKLVNYSALNQLSDVKKSFVFALFVSAIVFFVGRMLHLSSVLELAIQLSTGFIITVFLSEVLKISEYFYLKNMVVQNISKLIKRA